MRTIKAIVVSMLLVLPAICHAGGDYVEVRVLSIEQQDGAFRLQLVQTDKQYELIKNCSEFVVTVKYARVPWYSWLPFIRSAHPTKMETLEAIKYLTKAQSTHETVHFGYLGFGLVPADAKCSFKSKGLKYEIENIEKPAVFSYHDQT